MADSLEEVGALLYLPTSTGAVAVPAHHQHYLKILFISSWALFGGTRFGGAKRLYYFARELDRRVELHLLCLDGCQEWPPGEAFPSEFRRRLVLPMHPERPLWRRAAFLPAGVDEVLAAHRGAIDAFLGDARFDATLLAFPFSLAFLPWCRRERMGKQVYLEDDLLLENYRRDARSPSLPRKAKGLIRYRQALAYFREGLRDASDFVCISREEEEVVRPIFPALRTHVLKYGLPLCDYPCLPLPPIGTSWVSSATTGIRPTWTPSTGWWTNCSPTSREMRPARAWSWAACISRRRSRIGARACPASPSSRMSRICPASLACSSTPCGRGGACAPRWWKRRPMEGP